MKHHGDTGTTSLIGGTKVSKSDPRVEAYGTLDELSSHLGLLCTYLKQSSDITFVVNIQKIIFSISAYLATPQCETPAVPAWDVSLLDTEIAAIETMLPPLKSFILPGGCKASAQAHVSRTVCRRAERNIVALSATSPVDNSLIAFINRLSTYLFVLARKCNHIEEVE